MALNGTPRAAGRREAAALALATGRTVRDAAEKSGVGLRTLHRWLAEDADFRRLVTRVRSELFDRAVGRLADGAARAAEALTALLDSQSESVRLQAGKAISSLWPAL